MKWLAAPSEDQESFLDEIVMTAARRYDDEQTFALTNLMCAVITEREVAVARDGTGNRFEKENAAKAVAVEKALKYLDDLFWRLPDSRVQLDYETRKPYNTAALTGTKAFIFKRLLTQWKLAVPSEVSIRAFRRAIAMGWPLPAETKTLPGESDIELKVRGRWVSADERKQYLTTLRECLGGLTSDDPDSLFSHWFSLQAVPSDIRDLLAIARTRLGGHHLASRDVVRAGMLNGLPQSGVEVVAALAVRMRLAVEGLTRVKELIAKSIPAPHIHQSYFQRERIIAEGVERAVKYAFNFSPETVTLQMTVMVPDEMYGSNMYYPTVDAIEKVQCKGNLLDIAIMLRFYDPNARDRIVKECSIEAAPR